MTSLRSALATLLVLLVLVGATATAPPAGADEPRDGAGRQAEQAETESPTVTADREETLALVAGAAGLVILAGLGGGAWRSHRDPQAAALGH